MAIMAGSKPSNQAPSIEEGSYAARVYQVIHLGTIPGYLGAMQNKVNITFEFPTELKVFKEENGEQPCVLSKEYTLSTHEKSGLRKLIVACDPKALKADDDGFIEEYDIEKLLGKSCLVSVIHNVAKDGNTYANVDVETVLPKGMTCPPQVNESVSISYDNWSEEAFNKLPKFIQEKIKSSFEYKKMNEDPNEVPFESPKHLTSDGTDMYNHPFTTDKEREAMDEEDEKALAALEYMEM